MEYFYLVSQIIQKERWRIEEEEVELLRQGWVASHATDRIETSVGVGTGGRVPRSVVLALIMHNGGLACEVLVFSRPIMRHDPPH